MVTNWLSLTITTAYKRFGILLLALAITLVSFFWEPTYASACTRALWTQKGIELSLDWKKTGKDLRWDINKTYAITGRNMDWALPMLEDLWVFPRGVERMSDPSIVPVNAAKWVSKYGSIITSAYNQTNADGMNEKGLAAHGLWLSDTNYGKRDNNRPGIDTNILLQYFLDNFATVREAVDYLHRENPQVVPTTILGGEIKCHIAMEDAKGESLILEYINENGEPNIYYSGDLKDYPNLYDVLTNQPPYKEQLKNLLNFKVFGGDLPLPGSTSPAARFVRALDYTINLPEAISQRKAIANVLSVMRNTAEPFTKIQNLSETAPTIWRTVSDLEEKLYMYESSYYPTMIWFELNNIDLSADQPIRILKLRKHREDIGEASDQLEPTTRSLYPYDYQPFLKS